MGIISRDKNQINCIYSSTSDFGKSLPGYLESAEKDILLTDITENMPSSSQWQELAQTLNKSIKDFINTAQVDKLDDDSEYNEDNYLKILENNPNAMRGAIIIHGDNTEHIVNTTKVLDYFGVDSAGLEKTFHTEEPITKSTTKGDKFIK
ncbi:arsenate reductase family protein [Winogradskyella ursingii]|uniref:arsenate reductase family protein n=1 Tax=Winogradskyella ursingii TaxID=2686079 RepID=UPI0015C779BF|nr:hypothetical protein [Winogradskyella ursingii]